MYFSFISHFIMHLRTAKPPIHLITIITLVATFPISLTTPLSSSSAEDSFFSSQDLIFANDIPPSLSLDSTTPSNSVAINDAGENEDEPLMSFFLNDDYPSTTYTLDADTNLDLLSLLPPEIDCQSPANPQAEIASSDLSSLWTRDGTTTCPNPLGSQQQQQPLDIPSLTDLFQDHHTWLPKSPNPTELDLREGIRLYPPSGLLGGGNGECFFPHPMHCCCDGARALSGRTLGGLIRVVTIEGCNAGVKISLFSFFLFFLLSSILSSLLFIVNFSATVF